MINDMKKCEHPNVGCISQCGYKCLHTGPCEPVDVLCGKRFTVREWVEDGTRMTARDFITDAPEPFGTKKGDQVGS
jgi:hypothetical protein